MKKHRISRFYNGVYIFTLIMILGFLPLFFCGLFNAIESGESIWLPLFFVSCDIAEAVLIVCYLLFAEINGKIAFHNGGVVIHGDLRKRELAWSSFREYGIVPVGVAADGRCTLWVYGSPTCLTAIEKQKFLNKTRRKRKDIMYFQYRKEPFEEMLRFIPSEWAERLRQAEAYYLERMRLSEKLYHK